MHTMLKFAVSALSLGLALASPKVFADPFCCQCEDGKRHQLDESNIVFAGSKCTAKCKRLTVPKKGVCEAPAADKPAAAPSAAPSGSASVEAFKSDDCSGDAMKIDKSEAQLAAGILSYQVSQGVVRAYQKANFAGAATSPVIGSMCVSPGWPIGSMKIGQ